MHRWLRQIGEVNSSTGVKRENFHGLKRLKEATGKAFACGIVLHDGDRIQRVGPQLFAMPVSQLWS